MKKIPKYLIVGSFIGALIYLIIYLIKMYTDQEKEDKPQTLNDYLNRLKLDELKIEMLKGAFLGSLSALGILGVEALLEILTIREESETQEQFFHDKFLKNLLKEIKNKSPELSEEELHFNLIMNLCASEFKNELIGAPKLHGSRAKKVSHLTASDYDLALTFNSNGTVEETYWTVFERLKPKLKKMGYRVREQKFTTGVIVEKENRTTFNIDILPARVASNHHLTGDLWIWNSIEKTRQKTNIEGHNRQFVNNPEARDVAVLLKQIKNKMGINLPSPIINKIVPNVIKQKGSSSTFNNLKLSLDSIALNLQKKQIKDPFNSNNNFLNKFNGKEKKQTIAVLNKISTEMMNNPINVKRYL